MSRPPSRMVRWLVPLTILLLWVLTTEAGLIKPLYLPSPSAVLAAASDLRWSLITHTVATYGRFALGYVLGTALGLVWGFAMAHSPLAEALSHNLVESWRPVPPVALIPFLLLWFGFSETGKVVLVVLGVTLIVLIDTFEAARSIRPDLLRAAASLGASSRRQFYSVLVPATLPRLVGGLRIAAAIGIGLVVVSEFMGARNGLGYLINVSRITFRTPTIFLGILILGVASAAFDAGIRLIMDRLTFWADHREDTTPAAP